MVFADFGFIVSNRLTSGSIVQGTNFRQSFIVPTCISVQCGNVTTVDEFADFLNGIVVVAENATVESRVTIPVTVDRHDAVVRELDADARASAHWFVGTEVSIG